MEATVRIELVPDDEYPDGYVDVRNSAWPDHEQSLAELEHAELVFRDVPHARFIARSADGRIVGMARVHAPITDPTVTRFPCMLGVDPAERRHGIGTALLRVAGS